MRNNKLKLLMLKIYIKYEMNPKELEKELRDYIEKGDEDLKESRLLALETVLKLIEVKNGRY